MPFEGIFIDAAQNLDAQSSSFFELAQKKLKYLSDVNLMDDAHKRHKGKYSSLILNRIFKNSLKNKAVLLPIFGGALAISALAPGLYNVLRPIFIFVGADIGRKAFQHGVEAVKGKEEAEKTEEQNEQSTTPVVKASAVVTRVVEDPQTKSPETKPQSVHLLEKIAVRKALEEMKNADRAVAVELGAALVGSTHHLSLLVQAGTMLAGAAVMTGTVLFLTSAPVKMEHFGRSLQEWNPEGFWSGMAARTTVPRRVGSALRGSAPAVTGVMSWKWGKPVGGMIASGRVITESTVEPKFHHFGETFLLWMGVGLGVGLGVTVAEKFVYKPFLQEPLQNRVYQPLQEKVYQPVKAVVVEQWRRASHAVLLTHMLQKHVEHREPISSKPDTHVVGHPHHDLSKADTYHLMAHHPAGMAGAHPNFLMAATRA